MVKQLNLLVNLFFDWGGLIVEVLELVSGRKVCEVIVSSNFLFEPRVPQPGPIPNKLRVSVRGLEEAELMADSLTCVMLERVSIKLPSAFLLMSSPTEVRASELS